MSALEQIRKRPAITIGIIGFALVLFLFTGINGCDRILHSGNDTAAKVDGQKIKIQDLQDIARQNNTADANLANESALQSLIDLTLVEQDLKKLGIDVTEKELSNYLYSDPYLVQYYGTTQLYEAAQGGNEQAKAQLQKITDDIRRSLIAQKYQGLLYNSLTFNNLDTKAYYDANANTANLTLARLYMLNGNDDNIEVTDKEIADRYNSQKKRFAVDGNVTVADYIYVNIRPSNADYMAAQQEVEQVIPELQSTDGLEALDGKYDFVVTNLKGSIATITDAINNNREFAGLGSRVENLINDQVMLLRSTGDQYVIGKLLSQSQASEKAKLQVYALANPAANADTIAARLNAGEALDQLVVAQGEAQEISLIDGNLPAEVTSANIDEYTVFSPNGQDYVIFTLSEKEAPVEIYDIALIVRNVVPSEATFADELDRLIQFTVKNNTAATFAENSETFSNENSGNSQVSFGTTDIQPSQLAVRIYNRPIESSSAAAFWACDAKEGAVSEVFYDNQRSYLLALAVDNRFNEYRPLSDKNVENTLRNEILAEKKALAKAEALKGKGTDVASYAAAMHVQPENVSYNFGQSYDSPKFLAAVAAAKPGKLVGPLALENAVVVFTVDSVTPLARQYDFEIDRANLVNASQNTNSSLRDFSRIIRHDKKIDYSLQRFYKSEN